MERKFSFAPGEFYHLYGRGVNRAKIFLNSSDRYRFMSLLYLANSKKVFHLSDHRGKSFHEILELKRSDVLVDIGAYCLMPNHFHLLIHEREEKGISRFMLKLMTGFAMYHNKKYDRTGSLFEKPYKAQWVNNDRYLKYLFAYIHLNPISIKDPTGWENKMIVNPDHARDSLDGYQFSSYLDYVGIERPEKVLISRQSFPEYFSQNHQFFEFMDDWINFSKPL